MAKTNKRERIERAIKFWDDIPPSKFLLSESTIMLLDSAFQELRPEVLTINHVQAAILSSSLLEAQIRDCIRLRIDDARVLPNFEHEIFRDELTIDLPLFASLRGHKFSLGEFFVMNSNISTVSQVVNPIDFCFGVGPNEEIFLGSSIEGESNPKLTLKDLYEAIAITLSFSYRFIHELFDFTASDIDSGKRADRITASIRNVYLFLIWTQALKLERFSGEFPELNTPRGETGRAINETSFRIQQKLERISKFLDGRSDDPREQKFLSSLKQNLKKVQRLHADFSECAYEFIYYAAGPGTLAIDASFGRKLVDLENFERLLDRAIESKRIPE